METVTETCVLRVCLITQVLENLGVCALVNVELQSHRPFRPPKDAHGEGLFKGFFYIMPLKFDIPANFQILLTQLRDGRLCIVRKQEIIYLNKYINESLYLLLANPFPCCFRPHLS